MVGVCGNANLSVIGSCRPEYTRVGISYHTTPPNLEICKTNLTTTTTTSTKKNQNNFKLKSSLFELTPSMLRTPSDTD